MNSVLTAYWVVSGHETLLEYAIQRSVDGSDVPFLKRIYKILN